MIQSQKGELAPDSEQLVRNKGRARTRTSDAKCRALYPILPRYQESRKATNCQNQITNTNEKFKFLHFTCLWLLGLCLWKDSALWNAADPGSSSSLAALELQFPQLESGGDDNTYQGIVLKIRGDN